MQTLTIPKTDATGFGQPENPYNANKNYVDHISYMKDNPPLLVITPDGKPVINGEGLTVTGPHWQYKHGDEWLTNQNGDDKMNNIPDCFKREVYILSEPVEKAVQQLIGDTSFVHLTEGWVQIVTKNGAVHLCPEELEALNKFTTPLPSKADSIEERAALFVNNINFDGTNSQVKGELCYLAGAAEQEAIMKQEYVKVSEIGAIFKF